jgi:hypothetical protein
MRGIGAAPATPDAQLCPRNRQAPVRVGALDPDFSRTAGPDDEERAAVLPRRSRPGRPATPGQKRRPGRWGRAPAADRLATTRATSPTAPEDRRVAGSAGQADVGAAVSPRVRRNRRVARKCRTGTATPWRPVLRVQRTGMSREVAAGWRQQRRPVPQLRRTGASRGVPARLAAARQPVLRVWRNRRVAESAGEASGNGGGDQSHGSGGPAMAVVSSWVPTGAGRPGWWRRAVSWPG